MCVYRLRKQADQDAPTGRESTERYDVQPCRSVSVPLPQMWTDVSGVSKRSEPRTNIGSCQRAGGHAVSVGTLIWSGLAGIGENGACLSQKRKSTTRYRLLPDASPI